MKASGLQARIHLAAINGFSRQSGSRGPRTYFYVRLAALTFPVAGERLTIRSIFRMARPRLRRAAIQVDIHRYASDFHTSAQFYTAVGFDLHYDEDPFGNPPCYVGHLGPTQILIFQETPKPSISRGLRLGFRLDDPEAAMQRLTTAEIPFERPTPKNCARAHDPGLLHE